MKIPENVLQEKKQGNWHNVSELIEFKIVKFPPQGLLGKGKADVMLLYKKKPGEAEKDQKRLVIFGSEDAVYDRVMMKIAEKKNPAKAAELEEQFKYEWKKTEYEKVNVNPSWLLNQKIKSYGLNPKEFAAAAGLSKGTVYHHTSGSREISKSVAEEYAEKLNCDPVDLMFEKKTIPVWSKVNFLNPVELETLYNPGQLYAYAATSELEKVIVPRDIYREDIKAIKIDARGSMYHNKVCFYYRSNTKADNINNQLCIVGINVEIFPGTHEEHYYFGLYEEVRGKANLINPDPYVDVYKNKFILQDFTPTFITPIVSILNPEAVTDSTNLRMAIPSHKLIRQEEQLQSEINMLREKLHAEQQAVLMMKKKEHITRQIQKEIDMKAKAAEEEIAVLMQKVGEITRKINEDVVTKQKGIMSNLFKKETDVMDKIKLEQAKLMESLAKKRA